MPKVSVIISTYNRPRYVCEAINSVLGQTFRDSEIIVVDDGSTDDTRRILENYSSRICYIYQQNLGRAQARNTGIKAAKGEYLAFLDDDDIWLLNKLEKQIIFLNSNPGIGLVHTFTEVVDEGGRLLKEATKKRLKLYKIALKSGYTYEGMGQLCVMFISTVMVRKECMDKAGVFDSNTEPLEDWDFYLRFALKYRIGTVSQPLVRFRIHPAHTPADKFTLGRMNTSMKHLNLISSGRCNLPDSGKARYNFLIHLAAAYYIASDFKQYRKYLFEALKLNPSALFCFSQAAHLLVSLLPPCIIQNIRSLKNICRY